MFHYFLLQGMVVVAARATRLPIYSSFAKEGNLSDLFAKGEAISTLFNVMGIGAGIGLASTVCSTTQGKVHICRMTYHRLSYHYSCSITPSSGKYTQWKIALDMHCKCNHTTPHASVDLHELLLILILSRRAKGLYLSWLVVWVALFRSWFRILVWANSRLRF